MERTGDGHFQSAGDGEVSGTFHWLWQDRSFEVGYDLGGPEDAAPLLLLPAMSTVSTRREMARLARLLGDRWRTIAVDWPGFGDSPRPAIDYTPDLQRGFLAAFVDRFEGRNPAVVAAGHAAGYALDLEGRRPGTFSHLVLIAPTWRGPLPTVMGGKRPIQTRIRRLVQTPVIGELIYRLNVSRPVVRKMYRGHVFADADRVVTPAFLAEKMAVTRRPNARFASACFVTGALDPMADRESFLGAARASQAPILVVYGKDTPPRSRAEMAALAELPNVQSHVLERSALGLHEEMPEQLAPLIARFLEAEPAAARVEQTAPGG